MPVGAMTLMLPLEPESEGIRRGIEIGMVWAGLVFADAADALPLMTTMRAINAKLAEELAVAAGLNVRLEAIDEDNIGVEFYR